MKAHIVTLPGDYIGPEIVAQAVKVLNAVAEKYGEHLDARLAKNRQLQKAFGQFEG